MGRGREWGGEREGGISSLFFLELSVDRPSTKAPKGERTRAIPEERDPREYFPCVFVKLVLKRQTANQSLSFFRQLFQRDLSVKERSIDNHHRPPRIFPLSFVQRLTKDPRRVRKDNRKDEEVRDERKKIGVDYLREREFFPAPLAFSQFFGGTSQPGSLLNPQYDSGESSLFPSFFFRSFFLFVSLSFLYPLSVAEREGWREGTPPFRHLDDCGGGRIELQRKLIRRRAGPCTEGERGG